MEGEIRKMEFNSYSSNQMYTHLETLYDCFEENAPVSDTPTMVQGEGYQVVDKHITKSPLDSRKPLAISLGVKAEVSESVDAILEYEENT